MTRTGKVQYFESEGREHLPLVIKSIKAYLRALEVSGSSYPNKIVFMTRQGEGPMLAYNHLQSFNVKIIAVTFPRGYASKNADGSRFQPEIPEKVRQFFNGVRIPIITNRLPFESIAGADAHNREMSLLTDAMSLFGGSAPLAIQAVLQAVEAGEIDMSEEVIAATGDMALLVTASNTRMFLRPDRWGLSVNEIICKPRLLTRTRKLPTVESPTTIALDAPAEITPKIVQGN